MNQTSIVLSHHRFTGVYQSDCFFVQAPSFVVFRKERECREREMKEKTERKHEINMYDIYTQHNKAAGTVAQT